MIDSLILHAVIITLMGVAAAVAFVWFVWGLKSKAAVWIIKLAVPIVVVVSIAFVLFFNV